MSIKGKKDYRKYTPKANFFYGVIVISAMILGAIRIIVEHLIYTGN